MVRLFRKRYVVFKLDFPQFLSKRELLTFINDKVGCANNGDDLGRQHIRIIDYDPIMGLCIIRCDCKTVLALRSLKKSPEEQSIKTIKTSGTIKALKRGLEQFNSYRKTQRSYPDLMNRIKT